MACPVCNHTMQNIGATGQRIFWCPRCGTLKTESASYSEHEVPRWIRILKEASHTHLYSEFMEGVAAATRELQET